MAERWTAAQVNSLAPDAPSQKAGAKLGVPGPWSGLGYLEAERLLWGDCKGSGSKPYQVTVSVADSDTAYQCTCPSRKFPCKHALGLLLVWAAGTVADTETLPERVQAWADSRRDRAEKSAARSVAKAEKAAADPEGAAKRAAQRAERVGNGLADLDRWLTDQVAAGLSDAAALSYAAVDPVAKRLVDAQAPGVAGRVRTLAAARASSGDAWPDAVLAEFARLHLLCQAWTRLAGLPPAMQDTVRRRIGISVDIEAVRRDGERVADRWHVLGSRDRAADKLTERRIWLRGAESGRVGHAAGVRRRTAGARAGAAGRRRLPGRDGVPLRGAAAARADGVRRARPSMGASFPVGGTLQAAADEFAAALAADPWQDGWPVVIADAVPNRDGELADAEGRRVPLLCEEGALWRLLAVSGGYPVTVFGEYTDAGLEPLTVWAEGSVVAL